MTPVTFLENPQEALAIAAEYLAKEPVLNNVIFTLLKPNVTIRMTGRMSACLPDGFGRLEAMSIVPDRGGWKDAYDGEQSTAHGWRRSLVFLSGASPVAGDRCVQGLDFCGLAGGQRSGWHGAQIA